MVEAEVVLQMRVRAGLGWGAKRISAELGVARNTARRYVRDQAVLGVQCKASSEGSTTPPARRPCALRAAGPERGGAARDEARSAAPIGLLLHAHPFDGTAVGVQERLASDGVKAGVHTVQRAVEEHRREQPAVQPPRAPAPGEQMQIERGERGVRIGDDEVVVKCGAQLLVAHRCERLVERTSGD